MPVRVDPEKSTLHDAGNVRDLLHGEITATDAMGGFSVSPGMFFRPEENALFSKGLDDAGLLQFLNIYIRNKDDRPNASFAMNSCFQLAVDFHFHGVRAMGTGRADRYGQFLLL